MKKSCSRAEIAHLKQFSNMKAAHCLTVNSVFAKLSPVVASLSPVIASEAKQSRRQNSWIAVVGRGLPRNDRGELQLFHTFTMTNQAAFSLVEMLMALLVASLLLSALAPVMTRRMNENIVVQGNMSSAGATQFTKEIEYDSEECSDIKVDSDGSTYCEGEYEVKGGYNGYINVTVIGGGGGGGIAPTAGYTEYTTAQSHSFPVPAMVGNIEATLVSGGGGGGAGGQIEKTQTFVTNGNGNMSASANNIVTVSASGTGEWTIPEAIKNKQILATACGGGGGGGCSGGTFSGVVNSSHGYGGGTGGYIINQLTNFGNADKLTYYIGGGGAGGQESYNAGTSFSAGLSYGGGDVPYAQGAGNAGALLTSSTKGGTGGIGAAGTVSNWSNAAKTKGGDGGSPAGGEGATLHGNPCYSGKGGGGGAASQLVVGSGIYLNAPGGGGGAGTEILSSTRSSCPHSAGGGGGGGAGGGTGGGAGSLAGKGGSGGANASGISGATISTVFGNDYCNGGGSTTYINSTTYSGGYSGKSGAIRLRYIDYGPGGSGGGGAAIVPIQTVKVNTGETLTVHVGKGGKGGIAGYMDTVNKKVIAPTGELTTDSYGQESYLARNTSTKLLRTNSGGAYGAHFGCSSGAVRDSRNCGNMGWISNGDISSMLGLTISGFARTCGKTAGGNDETYEQNQSKWGNTGYSPKTEGGNGGIVNLFNGEIACEGGKGGTPSSPEGKAPTTGYGCGGGGGYTFYKGGDGGSGYARISWNKTWDTTTNSYKLPELGAGGGGASGNVLTYSIPVKSNQIIKFRIGKGGNGAYVSNNVLTQAANGGATIFGDVKAGGGGAGKSVGIDTAHNNILINGLGGEVSGVCHFGTVNYFNNKKCIKGIAGTGANNLSGGRGANFAGYTMTVVKKNGDEREETKKEIKGSGGNGGISDTGDNTNGENAAGYAAGGGGAALRDVGQVNSSSAGNITNNQNKGGSGGNGKIILEWYE